ncbi:phage minor capsid protein [Nocardia sp. NPDC004860]|uniref:phage minor capsid protein n=1 Tax=Nocardia sp. NPDC004860 TaxID=3154557 RepID=UPI0033B91F88
MPLKPSFGDRVAGPVVSLYNNAERSVLKWLARILMPFPGGQWVARMLARLLKLRRGVKRITKDLDQESSRRVGAAITASWEHGASAAFDDLGMAGTIIGRGQSDRLTREVFARIAATHPRIGAWAEQVFRQAIDAGSDPALSEAERAAAVQRILDQAAEPGVTGYTDPHGRRHNLVSYVETTVRAASTFAEVEAYISTLSSQGHDLVVVSDVPQACKLCRPFEGQVLSITGASGARTASDSFGRSVTVTVYASIAEARARGLWHPGCRHVVSVWTADSPLPPTDSAPDEGAYRAQQRQRYLERQVRGRQRVADVAQSPQTERAARRRLVDAQNQLEREPSFMAGAGGSGDGSTASRPNSLIPPSPFDSATTNAEVAQLLQRLHGINVEGFETPGVTLDTAQEIARGVHDMLTKYPQGEIETVAIRDFRQLLDPSFEPDRIFGMTTGKKTPDGRLAGKDLMINAMHAADPAYMQSQIEAAIASGLFPPEFAARPVYSTVVHEYGHVMEFATGRRKKLRNEAEDILDTHWRQNNPIQPGERQGQWDLRYKQWRAQLSGYSFVDSNHGPLDPGEALASSFADVEILGDRASDPAKVLHRVLVERSQQRGRP